MASFASTSNRYARFQSYSSKEWEDMKAVIAEMYRDEARPLHAVQAILAQRYGFRPTVAMLKKRIKKWELDRNKKHSDMIYALRIASDRESQGKKTVFSIRGRLVTLGDVKQYFRRKGVHDLATFVSETDHISPTTRIDCCTPEPESSQNSLGAHVANHDPSIVALPDPEQVDRPTSTTSALHQLEELLYLGQSYYDSIFEDAGWRDHDRTLDIAPLELFYHHLFDGQSLLEKSQIHEAFVHFGRAFDLVRSILDQKVLLFLPYILHLLLPDRRVKRQEVLSQLLDFVSTLIKECYPQLRPIQQSLSLLGSMSLYDRGETTKRLFRSVLNQVQVQFGTSGNTVVDPNILCIRAHSHLPAVDDTENYQLTAIAVQGLARDADIVLHEEHQMDLAITQSEAYTQDSDKVHRHQKPTTWHHDLKPDNILLRVDAQWEHGNILRTADVGRATFHSSYRRMKQRVEEHSKSDLDPIYQHSIQDGVRHPTLDEIPATKTFNPAHLDPVYLDNLCRLRYQAEQAALPLTPFLLERRDQGGCRNGTNRSIELSKLLCRLHFSRLRDLD